MTGDDILREEQLGRAAERRGLRLVKAPDGKYKIETAEPASGIAGGGPPVDCPDLDAVEQFLFSPPAHSRPLRRDEDYENAITPHAPHDGDWSHLPDEDE